VAVERGYSRVAQLDADFSHDPDMLPAMINATRDADVVIGSRYCRGGRVANWPWHRRLLSRFANKYVARVAGVTVRDSTSGFRCWTRRALECLLKIGVTSEGYAFQVETVFRAQQEGLRIVEIPITFTDRRAGHSKMSGQVIFESMLKPWPVQDNPVCTGQMPKVNIPHNPMATISLRQGAGIENSTIDFQVTAQPRR